MLRIARLLILSVCMTVLCVQATPEKNTIRVALNDLPGVDMLPTLIAIERSKEQGVDIKVSYMLSEGMALRSIVNQHADVGMGTPYQKIQQEQAPIRMFYQLSMLRFHPVIDTRYYNSWHELDGVEMYSHGKGSGTEALVNMMANKHGITYSKMIYLPGSGVRARAMINGRIHATVVDTERKNKLLSMPDSPFKALPIPPINASDEALYAHEAFLRSHQNELTILTAELLNVWQTMIREPEFVLEQRNKYALLPDLEESQIRRYMQEMVAEKTFPIDGGNSNAFDADLAFYGASGTITEPEQQQLNQYWDFSLLRPLLEQH
ncbi:ABC transporter substrate-binding protein [Aliamphritea spongicola]|uniref:ABC transporter substrate-binding protein n=1 Tax=Aliamphritea spongicola TaxID=707589 RepID=UPI00196A4916|nr:ABC transporter substrate-binding protein [Aliamphritea spongicola]MBN3563193.1 ABC transporter substrate-binding protein [Aliamphritea spongicola]